MPAYPRLFFIRQGRGVSHTPSERLRMEANDRQTGYVLGRMPYAPTYTDQKFDSYLLDESETWQVFGCMSLRQTSPRWETIKICIGARETRQGLDGYDQHHAILGE